MFGGVGPDWIWPGSTGVLFSAAAVGLGLKTRLFGASERWITESAALRIAAGVLAGLAVLVVQWRETDVLALWRVAILLPGLAYLAVVDLRFHLAPVRFCIALGTLGLMWQALEGGWSALVEGALSAAISWGILWLLGALYRRGRGRVGLGEGDAMILAVVGAWTSPVLTASALAVGASATLAVALIQARGARLNSTPFPLAPGLFLGSFVVLLAREWLGG